MHLSSSRRNRLLDTYSYGSALRFGARPAIFTIYFAPINRLINNFNIGYNKYADDTQPCAALAVPLIASVNFFFRLAQSNPRIGFSTMTYYPTQIN